MYNDNFGRFDAGLESNVQVLPVILDRAIRRFDHLEHVDADEVRQHIDLKCCKLILDHERDMTHFKRRLGLIGYNKLTDCLINLRWNDEDIFCNYPPPCAGRVSLIPSMDGSQRS